MKARQIAWRAFIFFPFQADEKSVFFFLDSSFLDSSSLVNAVFGVVDLLEFLLGCTAHIFA